MRVQEGSEPCGRLRPKQRAPWSAPTKEGLLRKHPIARATANGGGPAAEESKHADVRI